VDEAKHLLDRARDFLTSEDGLVGVRPELRYDSSFGVAVGARAFDQRSLGEDSLVDVRALVGTTGSLLGQVRLQAPHRIIGLHGRFERNRLAIFAGQNGETLEELEDQGLGRTRYAVDRGTVGLDSEKRFGRAVTLRAVGDLEVAEFEPGPGRGDDPPIDEVYDTMTISHFDDGTRLVRGGLELAIDTRREMRYGSGFALSTVASASRGVMGDPARFLTATSEGRLYLGFHDQAVVFRLRGGLIHPIDDEPIPFDQLLSPAGSDGMRGLSRGERRGPSEVVGTVEYRRLLTRSFDVMAFTDYGGALGETWDGFAWDRLEPSVGVGVRHVKHAWSYGAGTPDAGLQLAWAPNHGVHLLLSVGL